jgi:isopentenyl-diphosphate delta-isomerase
VEHRTTTGFERFRLVHNALPEVSLEGVDTSTSLFGKRLGAPLMIGAVTGGTAFGREINRNLAAAADSLRLGMCLGSQRVALEDSSTKDTFRVRDIAPNILLFANLGAIQLNNGFSLDDCQRAVEMAGADALTLHLNPLQEALQTGGDTNFGGLLARIEALCTELPVPVIVKEVGCGLSAEVAVQLSNAGVAALDVAGAGGTSWAKVQGAAAETDLQRHLAQDFAEWGIPTAESLVQVRSAVPDLPIIASGGIRSGIDAAKAIALGADAVSLALPLLKPASKSASSVQYALEELIAALRMAMFCTGSATCSDLEGKTFRIADGPEAP